MADKVLLVCLLGCIYLGTGASALTIKKCKHDDTSCLKESTQAAMPIFAAGIPELGMEKMDPIFIKHIDASTEQLKLVLNDIRGTGLKDCVAKKITRDISKSKLNVKFLCTLDFVAKYEMNGRLLVLPIEGNGDAHLILRKMELSIAADMGENTKGGEKYWFIKDFKHSYQLKDKATIELENLFPGNELLGRAARELIASSGNEIVVEVGPPVVKAVIKEIVVNVNKFFDAMPASQLEL